MMEKLKFKVGDCFFYKDNEGIISGEITRIESPTERPKVTQFEYEPIYFKTYIKYNSKMSFDKDSKLYKNSIIISSKMLSVLWRE